MIGQKPGMTHRLKRAIQRLVKIFGYRVIRIRNTESQPPLVDDGRSTPLPARFYQFRAVPGKVTEESASFLYMMAYASNVPGDIVELGSWQGWTTCFLAQACKDSKNGIVHAVDNFKGNPGKEHLYTVSREDLSDLRANFAANISNMGLADYVRLHNTDLASAFPEIQASATSVRMIFVDADHRYEEVCRHIGLYGDLLATGGIIALDDYSDNFPGVVKAVSELLLLSSKFTNPVQYRNTLVLKKS